MWQPFDERGLAYLDCKGLHEPQRMLVQRRTGRHRLPEIVERIRRPSPAVWIMHSCDVRSAPKRTGMPDRPSRPSDDPDLNATVLRCGGHHRRDALSRK